MEADHSKVAVPEHTILSRLGRGGMAAVYLAREERLGRLVAVKVIDERFDADPHFRKRFEREARTAAGLTHPNIVPIYHYGFTQDDRPFISMAFLEGGSLRDRLHRRGTLPVDEALAITRQISNALQVAHARNIIHRDLKPDNVLFHGETAMLTDFGIAKVLDAATELTTAGANPGTAKYSSPEQAQEKPIDQRSDIYTLGVVLYEMLTGRAPIEADTVLALMMRIAHEPPNPLPPSLKGLQPFMDVLLTKDPADRIGSCVDMTAIIQAMERNWARYGSIDRLTDGVTMTPSGRGAPEANQDDETLVHGAAPTAVEPLPKVDLVLRKPQDETDFTTADTANPASLTPSSERRYGLLTLGVQPPGALVLLDYIDTDKLDRREVWTGKPLRLPAGPIRMFASAAGYEELHATIDMGVLEVRYDIALKALTQPRAPRADEVTQATTAAQLLSSPQSLFGSVAAPIEARSAPPGASRSWVKPAALAGVALLLIGLTFPLWRGLLLPETPTAAVAVVPVPKRPSTPSVAPVLLAARSPNANADANADASAAGNDGRDLVAHHPRRELVTQLVGNWTFADCAHPAVFSIAGKALLQSWPDVGPAREHIVWVTEDTVTTQVVMPVNQRGQKFRYRPSGAQMIVEDVTRGRSATLRRCP